jgi:hypothetical protein
MKQGQKKEKQMEARKEKEPKWKAQSEAFRSILKQERLLKNNKEVPK